MLLQFSWNWRAGMMVNHVKLLPTTLTSHLGTGSSPRCSISDTSPKRHTLENSMRQPNWAPAPMWEIQWNSWFLTFYGPVLTVAAISEKSSRHKLCERCLSNTKVNLKKKKNPQNWKYETRWFKVTSFIHTTNIYYSLLHPTRQSGKTEKQEGV